MRAFVLACLCFSSLASAQPTTGHRHLGFYLRLDAGLGGFGSKLSDQDLQLSGGFGSFGLAIGGALTENLILAGHLFGMSGVNPGITSRGVTVQSNDTSVGLGAVGPQLTYYFMPIDLFLSGTIGLSRVYSTVRGSDSTSEYGGALQLAVGKEWWVGEHWGLGVALQLTGSTNRFENSEVSATWSSGLLGVAFSATYN
jgi:hypothetical protein